MKNKNSIYVFGGLVILVLSILSGYFLGNMILKPAPQNIMVADNLPEVINENQFNQEEMNTDEYSQDDMKYDYSEVEPDSDAMYQYTNEELGFTLSLPAKFNVLEAESREYDTYTVVDFYLPVNPIDPQMPSKEIVFGIIKIPSQEDISQLGPGALLTESADGYQYYYSQPVDMAIKSEQPEYEVYMSLVNEEVLPYVEAGFELL